MRKPPKPKHITPGWMTAESNKALADLDHDDKDTIVMAIAVMGEMGYDVTSREQTTNFEPVQYGPMMLSGFNILAGAALGKILQTVHTATLSDHHFTKDIEDDVERLEAIRNLYEQAIREFLKMCLMEAGTSLQRDNEPDISIVAGSQMIGLWSQIAKSTVTFRPSPIDEDPADEK